MSSHPLLDERERAFPFLDANLISRVPSFSLTAPSTDMSVENYEETPLLGKKPRATSSAWPTMKSIAVGALCVTAGFAGTLVVTGRSSTANSSAALGVPSSAALGVPRVNANYYPKTPATPTTTVSQVNLAMSHDSGCNPGDYAKGPNKINANHGAVTQGVTLEKQYQAGVRVFDIRVTDDAHLFHQWLGMDYKFGVLDRITDLGAAARAANDICIIKLKGSARQVQSVENALGRMTSNADTATGNGKYLATAKEHTDFDSKKTKINDIKGRCFVFPDDRFKAAMNAKKLESGQFRKVMGGDRSFGTIQKVFDLHKAQCKGGNVVRAGFTNTGVFNSPLCMSYKDQAAISTKLNEILANKACSTIFSTDGVESMIGVPDAGIVSQCKVQNHENNAEAAAEETEYTSPENPEIETGKTAA
jgi:hypothetical protein